jgi:hypothetical protein
MSEQEIILPTKTEKATRVNPKRLIIYSKPKIGKTTAFAGLKNNLIIDLEDGSGFVDAMRYKVNNLSELIALGTKIKEEGKPYDYVTIDTVTKLEEMVMPLAVKNYKKTPMGKNFQSDSVLTLPNGAGYLYVREAFFQILDFIDGLADHIILSGHIKDKSIDDKGETVVSASIDLTGKIKSLICANADAIGFLYRKKNECILSFKTNDETLCGARSGHLKNQEIVLSEDNDGKIKTYWDKIYV